MFGCFQTPHPLPARPWEAPHSLLCSVDGHLLYCDPGQRLSYVDPAEQRSYRLHCGPSGAAAGEGGVVPDAQCQALPFAVQSVVAHTVGHCLLAVGERAVALVELPPPAAAKAKRGNRCAVRLVGAELFRHNALLRVVQARWHPLSDRHVVLLTSDRTLWLFNTVRNAEEPEQRFGLWTAYADSQPVGDPNLSFQKYERDADPQHRVVGFAFLAGEGWNPFMVLYATAVGDVYCLGPVLPFGCVVQGDLFDTLPLPTTAGGLALPFAVSEELRARRDDWRKAVLKFDPALQDATPGVRIFVTRETGTDFAAQFITAVGPINVEDDEAAHCASIEVLAVSPPVVALGLRIPAVKLFALTRPIYPTWLLEILGDDSLQNVEVLELFEVAELHTKAAPGTAASPLAHTALHPDPLRPDRLLASHPAQGVFALQLPAFFLPALDDRQLPLRSTTVMALVVAAIGGGGWPTTMGLAVVHWDPDTPLQTGSQLYCLTLQSANGREFSVVLQAIDLATRPLLSATHSLGDAERPDAIQPPPPPSSGRPACVGKAEELQKALRQLDAERYIPLVGQPLQPVAGQEEEQWVELFRRMMKDLQQDRMERIQQLVQQVDVVEKDTEHVAQASTVALDQLKARLAQLPARQQQLRQQTKALVEKQQQLLAKNQELAEAVFRRAKGCASDHEVQFAAQLQRMREKFIPWCEGKAVDLAHAIKETPAAEAEPVLYAANVADLERVARGTMDLIVACKALALDLSHAAEP